MPENVMKRLPLSILTVALLSAGCAQKAHVPEPVPEPVKQEIAYIYVPISEVKPGATFEAYAVGKDEGFTKGAKKGFVVGATALLIAIPQTAGVVLILYIYVPAFVPATLGITTLVGGVYGMMQAEPGGKVTVYDTEVPAVLHSTDVEELLLFDIASHSAYMPDYSFIFTDRYDLNISADQYDAMLFIYPRKESLEYDTSSSSTTPTYSYNLSVDAELLRAEHNTSLFSDTYLYTSDSHTVNAWLVHDWRLLKSEQGNGYRLIIDEIMEDIFLVPEDFVSLQTNSPFAQKSGDDRRALLYGPKIIGPDALPIFGNINAVSSCSPTLEWMPFPTEYLQTKDSTTAARISDITYEVRIWQRSDGELVYEKKNIPATQHAVEKTLKSDTTYEWSARTLYKLDGRTRATKWRSYVFLSKKDNITHVGPHLGRSLFKTPEQCAP